MSGFDNTSYTARVVTTASTTITNQDSIVVMSATGAKAAAILGAGLVQPGRMYTLVNTGASGNATITPSAGTIDGAATLPVLPDTAVTFVAIGTDYVVISDKAASA